MASDVFKNAFQNEILTNYHGAWVLLAGTKKGFLPVGLILGFYSHPDPRLAPFMIVGDILWMPWASARNKIEAAVHFFNSMRNEIPFVDYAQETSKPFFEVLMRHGIMRRIGTSYNVYSDGPAAVYETRRD